MSDSIADEKEKLLIEFLLSKKELFIKCSGVLEPKYFDEPLDRVIDFSMDYYQKYHNIPDTSVINAVTGIELTTHDIEQDEFDFVTDEIEKHCQQAAMRLAILEGADILSEEDDIDFGKINNLVRNALLVSIDKDLGTNCLADPASVLTKMEDDIDARSIGWVNMDMITDKVKRGELFMFAGNSGSGKSVVLANVANNMSAQGLNVLIVSLELDENLISKRMYSICTEVENKDLFDKVEEVSDKVKELTKTYGTILVKRMPVGSNANAIRSYLMEYEIQFGFKPDVICVDYLDLLSTNERIQGNAFDIDKIKSEELREIFQDYKAYGFTASQLNRDSVDTERKTQAHIAGGISKINTSDVAMAIIRNEEQQDNGEIHFQLLKLRNSGFSFEPIVLHWDDRTLKITENQKNSGGGPSSRSKTNDKVKNRLNDILGKKK